MKKPLFRLLYTVKMIFDVSTFYNRLNMIMFVTVLTDFLLQSREGGLPDCEDHQPSDPQLQALHHRKWQPDHLGSGKNVLCSAVVTEMKAIIHQDHHCQINNRQRYHSNNLFHQSFHQQSLIILHHCLLHHYRFAISLKKLQIITFCINLIHLH